MGPWLLGSAVALLLAVPPIWPYIYYTLLRLLVSGVAIGALFALRPVSPGIVVAFVLVALLFNPLLPVHLTKAVWVPIDLGVAAFFLYVWSRKVGLPTALPKDP